MTEPTWSEIETTVPNYVGTLKRTAHSATLVGGKIYILGGLNVFGTDALVRIFIFDITSTTWTTLPVPQGLDGRDVFSLFAHTGTLIEDRILFIGGFIGMEGVECSDLVFSLDLVRREFTVNETTGHHRGPIADHSADLLPREEHIVVYGGQAGDEGFTSDPLYSLNVKSMKWSRLPFKGRAPSPRGNHGSCLVYKTLYIFGGASNNYRVLRDLHILDLAPSVPEFSEVITAYAPEIRFGTVFVHDRGQLFLFGGKSSFFGEDDRLNDLYRFDLRNKSWHSCGRWMAANPPLERSNHKAVKLQNRVLVFGGVTVNFGRILQLALD